jgi:hypothetical protein
VPFSRGGREVLCRRRLEGDAGDGHPSPDSRRFLNLSEGRPSLVVLCRVHHRMYDRDELSAPVPSGASARSNAGRAVLAAGDDEVVNSRVRAEATRERQPCERQTRRDLLERPRPRGTLGGDGGSRPVRGGRHGCAGLGRDG